jgi:hypothetical protein
VPLLFLLRLLFLLPFLKEIPGKKGGFGSGDLEGGDDEDVVLVSMLC